jgi:hypothetical protein
MLSNEFGHSWLAVQSPAHHTIPVVHRGVLFRGMPTDAKEPPTQSFSLPQSVAWPLFT